MQPKEFEDGIWMTAMNKVLEGSQRKVSVLVSPPLIFLCSSLGILKGYFTLASTK
jgi:hypothetical protein